jgi:hypothetical protein
MLIQFDEDICHLRKIISGGQTGADVAGLFIAEEFGIETGGTAPLGYRTLAGNNPKLLKDRFKLEESNKRNYQVRTALNAKNSDGTIRLATNFNSPGEICTLNAISKYKKPYFDIDLKTINTQEAIEQQYASFKKFLISNQIQILNVAGNADRNPFFGKHFELSCEVLFTFFSLLQKDFGIFNQKGKNKNETI